MWLLAHLVSGGAIAGDNLLLREASEAGAPALVGRDGCGTLQRANGRERPARATLACRQKGVMLRI